VVVKTRVQTPLFWGQASRAGDLLLYFLGVRPLRMSWLTVGNEEYSSTQISQWFYSSPGG
jgi:hypothetical protein